MLENCIRDLAVAVQKAILNPPQSITNVGEWSKKEACWEKIRQLSVPCTQQLEQWIVSKEEFKKTMRDDGITLQKTVLDLTSRGYWMALLRWPQTTDLLPPAERDLVTKASTLQGFMKINIEKDWRKLLNIKQLCEEEEFRTG